MTLKALLSAMLLASVTTAAVDKRAVAAKIASGEAPLCGTHEPSEADKEFSKAMLESERSTLRTTPQPISIDTYFHIVPSGESEAQGNISDDTISQQLDVLNAGYAPHNISFNLAGTTRTVNAEWSESGDPDAIREMRASLRKGSYSALNVYVVNRPDPHPGVIGIATFPQSNVVDGDATFLYDGTSIDVGTVPGGSMPPYNLGGTLVHEVGHWLNLYHTFQGGCAAPGDYVDDTPYQGEAGRACDPGVVYDTCPNEPGTDAIYNWMNYTGDECWDEFSPGQETRIYSSWSTFRE